MKEMFKTVIKGHTYELERVFYPDSLLYHIHLLHNGQTIIFRMKKDDEGMWKIQAQALPDYVFDAELSLNDVISENESQ